MAHFASNRLSVLGDASLADKLDFRWDGKVCWADLVDDQSTNLGDSPRSMASSYQGTCENQAPLERKLWADMVDSDSEASDASDEIVIVPTSSAPPQVPHPVRTIARERVITQDELDTRVERRQESEHIGSDTILVRVDIDKRKLPGQHGRAWASNVGKGAGKVGGKSLDRPSKKGAGKGGKKGVGKGASTEKYQCQFIIGIEEDSKFHVVRRVLGTGGENMKRIAGESGGKLRLRGRGSKFLEGPEQKESDDDLMLCISSLDAMGFETAKRAVSELIEDIHQHYRAFCQKAGYACPELEVKIHEGYRAGSR